MGDTVFRLHRNERSAPALDVGHLHEVHAQPDDGAAALAYALTAGCKEPRALFLIRATSGRRHRRMRPYGPGLRLMGLDPARLVLVDAASELDLLRAGLDAARCSEAGVVILEAPGKAPLYDLTASRRLALAAERSRACVIVLRGDAEPRASAAETRWQVASAPSTALEANAPGMPAIDIELLRWRAGPAGGRWRLEWDKASGTFRTTDRPDRAATMPGAVVSFPGLRADAEGSGRTAIG